MNQPFPSKTPARILNAAEMLFAQHGYDGTSMRNITRKAGVNLAASHYHLGDKESLYALVFTRRLQPVNEARLARLQQAELAAAGRPVPLPLALDIMARPLFELCADARGSGRYFARILGRSLTDPLPFMDGLLARQFQPAMARFAQALRRHAPNLSPEEFLWRLSFVIGAMHHTLATLHCMQDLTRGICRNDDHGKALTLFVEFAALALTAPATANLKSPGA
ncbi:MAG: TetR/AcrR family transcriptional regulator [bacterium]|nr:TetR/AcrR family transcriptional regulator [bacterium]MDI1337285.1 TetR/AcrR family transcriptional regulator [Lacunisphaera sp.]